MNGPASSLGVKDRPMTRIEGDVENVKAMISRVESTTGRIINHARTLGYYDPTPEGKAATAPTAVITTLSDALRALDQAIDHCSGSLNVFD